MICCESPTFFVARGQQPIDSILLVAFLSFVLPAAVFLPVLLLHKLHEKISSILMGTIIFVLVTFFVLQILKSASVQNSLLIVSTSSTIAALTVVAYFRLDLVKKIFTALAVVGLVYPSLYLIQEGNWNYILKKKNYEQQTEVRFSQTPPIIFIVFDEFHLVSLMNAEKRIDASLFPNFGRLPVKIATKDC